MYKMLFIHNNNKTTFIDNSIAKLKIYGLENIALGDKCYIANDSGKVITVIQYNKGDYRPYVMEGYEIKVVYGNLSIK